MQRAEKRAREKTNKLPGLREGPGARWGRRAAAVGRTTHGAPELRSRNQIRKMLGRHGQHEPVGRAKIPSRPRRSAGSVQRACVCQRAAGVRSEAEKKRDSGALLRWQGTRGRGS